MLEAQGLAGGAAPAPLAATPGEQQSAMDDIAMEPAPADSGGVPPPEEQASAIQAAEEQPIAAGDQLYIVSAT